jgi:oxidase EvaA
VSLNVLAPPTSAPHGSDLARRLGISAGARLPIGPVEQWLAERLRRNTFEVAPAPLTRLDGWYTRPGSGDLVHRSGRFFSVEGIEVSTDYGPVRTWAQPIIDQPDCSILGILVKEIDGVLRFLMQAKMEPGNANVVQLSPTVQATNSNCERAHNGARPRYLEYFVDAGADRVLVDVAQSEQGSWFHGKRNRNVVVETTRYVPAHEDFAWLTLGQILELVQRPNAVNMDTRTVLSCLPVPAADESSRDDFDVGLHRSAVDDDRGALHPTAEVQAWLSGRKAAYSLVTRRLPLDAVPVWRRSENEIFHPSGKYFTVHGVQVQATNREVHSWCQPLLAPCGLGLVGFVARNIEGTLHVLAHADLRVGYRDSVELGPTVQCTPPNWADLPAESRPPFLDVVQSALDGGRGRARFDVLESEEGGRFDHAVTRHLVVEVGDEVPLAAPPDFCWVTLAQLAALARRSFQVNVEARSLLLCLESIG